ncbi:MULTISPECIES: DPP IV N-terminal domain-containing protein [Chitinophagaceae]
MKYSHLLMLALGSVAAPIVKAQDSVTVADYTRAESRLSYNTTPLVRNVISGKPIWDKEGKGFWYTKTSPKGTTVYVHVELDKHTKTETNDASVFPAKVGHFSMARKRDNLSVISPDSSKRAYIDNYNLWIEDTQTHTKKQLTFDGVKDFGYATDNAGWKHSEAPILRWSPDSKKITTFQLDERNVGDMYLVTTNVGHPTLKAWKYPLPGDTAVAMLHRVVIDIDNSNIIRFQIQPDFHRGTLSDDIASSGTFDDIDWNPDGSEVAFVSTSRDHKNEKFRIANTKDGSVREIFEETVATQFESGRNAINWRYLPATNEIIWYSERDNWGHLYLYDAKTGKLKNQITKGDWLVADLFKVDEKNRKLYFTAAGLQKENPYFQSFCSIDFSGKNFKNLTPEIGTHQITFSPDETSFVDQYSQPNIAPIALVRKLDGGKMMDLEKADITALEATGWKAPIPVQLKAGDGLTDVYGLLFQPSNPIPGKKYPIIDYIYPGPQGGSVGSWAFSASRGDNNALAELGAYVLVLEGTSNPFRSKSYHDMSYGNMAINTLPDQIAAIRQLSSTYAIDTTKVGIWGHSGGGFATACAMFKYPDFFKVGISESGNHDNRNYEDDWGERYNGLVQNSDYAAQANQLYANNLKGKLLIAHGMMDDNVPPYNSLLVIEALEKANKDYDFIVFPNSPHGYGEYTYYMMRRRWDYFVQNLLGEKHPKEFPLGPKK